MQIKGKILWTDLTVDNPEQIKYFYGALVGWTFSEQHVGDYVYFNVHNPEENNEIISGICHRKGSNSKILAQWLNYVSVDNLKQSLENCLKLGGKTFDGPRKMGKDLFALYKTLPGHV